MVVIGGNTVYYRYGAIITPKVQADGMGALVSTLAVPHLGGPPLTGHCTEWTKTNTKKS